MEQEESRFQHLLGKYLSNSCSAEELDEFRHLTASTDFSQEAFDTLGPLWESRENSPPDSTYTRDIYNTVMLRASGWERQDRVRTLGRRRLTNAGVAAAVLLLAAVAGVLYYGRNHVKKHQEMTAQTQNGILPGSNKATLTLDNGQVIDLDKAATGKLAQEGTTTILKNGDGKIDYSTQPGIGRLGTNKVATPKGGQYQITLPDGTRVWLNAASSLSYQTAFTGTDRRVTLTGEAYFEIAPMAQMPFYVNVAGMDVLVLGTSFNVKAYQEEAGVYTTLVEGAVALQENQTGNRLLLQPGDQGMFSRQGALTKKKVDVEAATGWKNGYFSFDANLASIMGDVARWYDVTVQFRGDVAQRNFSGTISRYTRIEDVLAMLETTKSVHFIIQGRQIIAEPWIENRKAGK